MNNKNQQVVRLTHGDGRWVQSDKAILSKKINEYIGAARVSPIKGRIIGAISPHAGYVHSGAVAGYVFRALQEQARTGNAPDTVVILGCSHRCGYKGVALMDGDAIRSPLGDTLLDKEASQILTNNRPLIYMDYAPHYGEHSAENQIPFMQAAMPGARLVVGLIGDHDPKALNELASGLIELGQARKIMVITSSDVLHDPGYSLVPRTDGASLTYGAAMKTSEFLSSWKLDEQTICGMSAVAVMMLFAEKLGCREGIVLRYRNMSDDHPDSPGNWTVGYGAVVFPLPVPGPRPPQVRA